MEVGYPPFEYFDKDGKTYISLDYFHSNFTEQLLVDNTSNEIHLYLLSDVPDSYSYTNNFQIDFSTEPVRGLTLTFTGRYTDAGRLWSIRRATSSR